jgi:hypothetical protein
MSEDLKNPGTEFEREDLSTRGVFVFMIGLAIIGLVIYFIIIGMYKFLDNYEHAQMKTASPLSTSMDVTSRKIDFKPGEDYVEQKFKDNGAPMLENDERTQFKKFIMDQEMQLNTYGMDEKTGVGHMPIERAMDLMVERKMPVLPQGAAETVAAPDSKLAAKKAAAKK